MAATQAPIGDAPIISDQQLHAAIVEFIAVDDRLKEVAAKLKPARKKHRALKDRITEYMKRSGRQGVLFNDRTEQFVLEQRERKVKLDEAGIKQRILRASRGDEEVAQRVYDFVFENPETEVVDAFSRKKTVFGRADAHYGAADIPNIDPSELSDVREMTRYTKARGAYNEMQEKVRSNQVFEV